LVGVAADFGILPLVSTQCDNRVSQIVVWLLSQVVVGTWQWLAEERFLAMAAESAASGLVFAGESGTVIVGCGEGGGGEAEEREPWCPA
jgi:hypothetical protein